MISKKGQPGNAIDGTKFFDRIYCELGSNRTLNWNT